MAGNFILAEASRCLASLGNAQVIDIVATVIEDLVRGERERERELIST